MTSPATLSLPLCICHKKFKKQNKKANTRKSIYFHGNKRWSIAKLRKNKVRAINESIISFDLRSANDFGYLHEQKIFNHFKIAIVKQPWFSGQRKISNVFYYSLGERGQEEIASDTPLSSTPNAKGLVNNNFDSYHTSVMSFKTSITFGAF